MNRPLFSQPMTTPYSQQQVHGTDTNPAVWRAGLACRPSDQQLSFPTAPCSPNTGCPNFIVFNDMKEWCQRGIHVGPHW